MRFLVDFMPCSCHLFCTWRKTPVACHKKACQLFGKNNADWQCGSSSKAHDYNEIYKTFLGFLYTKKYLNYKYHLSWQLEPFVSGFSIPITLIVLFLHCVYRWIWPQFPISHHSQSRNCSTTAWPKFFDFCWPFYERISALQFVDNRLQVLSARSLFINQLFCCTQPTFSR